MNVLYLGQILPHNCDYICGQRKGERFEAFADNLVEALTHCSIAYLFPT